jgi:hypothetical protein
MRRILLVLAIAALWAAIMGVMAMPALGDPPTYTCVARQEGGGVFTVPDLHPADAQRFKRNINSDPQFISVICTKDPRVK